ncbi:hypothetical protein [Streptomyces sp. V1I1]|uniref:hypothetical protein n=1 Tax=Streptomyces sp. V1I1 TaxID=3042272 RepID=UPI0027854466|nr:hypothetical protein [Streptomyces sp. V1I1]MDQ0943309.1 hypothetical protein [Streptomyces sp. V1I1]
MTAARVEPVGALFVDLGEGREDKERGGIRYTRQPRAKYECLLCHATEGPVTGPIDVRQFVATIRDAHKTTCRPTHPNQKGNTSA